MQDRKNQFPYVHAKTNTEFSYVSTVFSDMTKRFYVDERPTRIKMNLFSQISSYVWTRPKAKASVPTT